MVEAAGYRRSPRLGKTTATVKAGAETPAHSGERASNERDGSNNGLSKLPRETGHAPRSSVTSGVSAGAPPRLRRGGGGGGLSKIPAPGMTMKPGRETGFQTGGGGGNRTRCTPVPSIVQNPNRSPTEHKQLPAVQNIHPVIRFRRK